MPCVGVEVAGVDPVGIPALDHVAGTVVVIGPIGPSTVSRLTICPAESSKSHDDTDSGHFFTVFGHFLCRFGRQWSRFVRRWANSPAHGLNLA